jgi:hypothetical protein
VIDKEAEATRWLQFGYSKNHHPDWRQSRQLLGPLDPAGVPLVSDTLGGQGCRKELTTSFHYNQTAVNSMQTAAAAEAATQAESFWNTWCQPMLPDTLNDLDVGVNR